MTWRLLPLGEDHVDHQRLSQIHVAILVFCRIGDYQCDTCCCDSMRRQFGFIEIVISNTGDGAEWNLNVYLMIITWRFSMLLLSIGFKIQYQNLVKCFKLFASRRSTYKLNTSWSWKSGWEIITKVWEISESTGDFRPEGPSEWKNDQWLWVRFSQTKCGERTDGGELIVAKRSP